VEEAGVGSVFPAGSVARTSKACEPSARLEYELGLVQEANAPASSLHSKVLPASVDVKEKLALVWLVGFAGVEVIDVFGGPVSIVQVWLAGVGSVLPTGSIARTCTVWLPSASPVYVLGLVQEANAPASSLHSNVLPASEEVKLKVALVWLVGLVGAEVIVVSGGVASTVHVYVAGVGSTFPAGSVALTSNV
jgi:hypothetical protein